MQLVLKIINGWKGNFMKALISLVLICVMMSGCNVAQNTEKPNVKVENQTTANEKNRAKSLSDIYIPNPQVSDDTNLLKVGQTIKDDKGEITLKEISSLNKTFKLGSLEMKIKNVKLIQNLPTYSLMDYFHYYTESYEDFQFVKIEVELVNKSNETVHFGPVAHLTTSNEEERVFEDDFYIEYLGGEIGPKSSKQGSLGFIVEKSSPEIKWVELTTSDVLNDQQKTIAKAQKLKIDFN
jgi:Domain of unknown function (DUF4352)